MLSTLSWAILLAVVSLTLSVFGFLIRKKRISRNAGNTQILLSAPEHNIKLWSRQGSFTLESEILLHVENSSAMQPLFRDVSLTLLEPRWWGRKHVELVKQYDPVGTADREVSPIREFRVPADGEKKIWAILRHYWPTNVNPYAVTPKYSVLVKVAIMGQPVKESELAITIEEFLANVR